MSLDRDDLLNEIAALRQRIAVLEDQNTKLVDALIRAQGQHAPPERRIGAPDYPWSLPPGYPGGPPLITFRIAGVP
jgi:hypothetical protein